MITGGRPPTAVDAPAVAPVVGPSNFRKAMLQRLPLDRPLAAQRCEQHACDCDATFAAFSRGFQALPVIEGHGVDVDQEVLGLVRVRAVATQAREVGQSLRNHQFQT